MGWEREGGFEAMAGRRRMMSGRVTFNTASRRPRDLDGMSGSAT
jgi:hypothetical protein